MENISETSVSEREAEQQYPTQYWEGTKIKRSFDMTTDDLQDAYMRGREAKPCKEQIETAAKVLADWSDPCIDCFEDRCRHIANLMLEAARKAVME